MSPEQPAHPPLTAQQQEMADFLLAECGLEDHANTALEMMGASGTVRYGLGRCAHHLMGLTPDAIREMVLFQLEQQEQAGA